MKVHMTHLFHQQYQPLAAVKNNGCKIKDLVKLQKRLPWTPKQGLRFRKLRKLLLLPAHFWEAPRWGGLSAAQIYALETGRIASVTLGQRQRVFRHMWLRAGPLCPEDWAGEADIHAYVVEGRASKSARKVIDAVDSTEEDD